ncbi:hypothetical protein ABPG72_021319 [Tetrahymena utriculariae]
MIKKRQYFNNLGEFERSSLSSLIDIDLTIELKVEIDGLQVLSSAIEKCINVQDFTLILKSNQIGQKGLQNLSSAIISCSNMSKIILKLCRKSVRKQGMRVKSNQSRDKYLTQALKPKKQVIKLKTQVDIKKIPIIQAKEPDLSEDVINHVQVQSRIINELKKYEQIMSDIYEIQSKEEQKLINNTSDKQQRFTQKSRDINQSMIVYIKNIYNCHRDFQINILSVQYLNRRGIFLHQNILKRLKSMSKQQDREKTRLQQPFRLILLILTDEYQKNQRKFNFEKNDQKLYVLNNNMLEVDLKFQEKNYEFYRKFQLNKGEFIISSSECFIKGLYLLKFQFSYKITKTVLVKRKETDQESYIRWVFKYLNFPYHQYLGQKQKLKMRQQIRIFFQNELNPYLMNILILDFNILPFQNFQRRSKLTQNKLINKNFNADYVNQEYIQSDQIQNQFMQILADKIGKHFWNANHKDSLDKYFGIQDQILDLNFYEEYIAESTNFQKKIYKFIIQKYECLKTISKQYFSFSQYVEISRTIFNKIQLKKNKYKLYIKDQNYEMQKKKSQESLYLFQRNYQSKGRKKIKQQICKQGQDKEKVKKQLSEQVQYNLLKGQKIKNYNTKASLHCQQTTFSLSQTKRKNLQNLVLKNKMNKVNKKMIKLVQNQTYLFSPKINIEKQISKNHYLLEQINDCIINDRLSNQNKQSEKLQQRFDSNFCQGLENQTQNQFYTQDKTYQCKMTDLCITQVNKLLGGGVCGSKPRFEPLNSIQELKQEIKEKKQKAQNSSDKKKEEDHLIKKFEKFNISYNQYFTVKDQRDLEESLNIIETDTRQIIEKTLYDFREQIVLQDIRHKVIDVINLLINYLLIIKQNDSKSSVQSDINEIGEKLEKLSIYCKENKKRHPCLDLYQYFEILKTLNSQRVGLDEANKHVAIQIIEKIIEVARFGAGFVSISGAIKNLTEFDLNKLNRFIGDIQKIAENIGQSSKGAIQQGYEAYSNYNSNNIANNMLSLWLSKVKYMGDSLSDSILEIIFYLEEIENISNNDTRLFVYMQLNYLLSKQQIKDNFKKLSQRLEELNKSVLIINQVKFLQVEEYSDSILDKLKILANLIAQSHQFRYVKAQLLFHFAQIISLSNKSEFSNIMISTVSNYLQEKQKSVKIVYQNNNTMADFIHNHLDKTQVLTQINQFKTQMTKHLDEKSQYNDFAYEISNEKDLDKYLAKYFVEKWEQSVKLRQQELQMSHKDDILLETINLYVNQQLNYQEGFQMKTKEKDAVKQIIDQFLIPNYEYNL